MRVSTERPANAVGVREVLHVVLAGSDGPPDGAEVHPQVVAHGWQQAQTEVRHHEWHSAAVEDAQRDPQRRTVLVEVAREGLDGEARQPPSAGLEPPEGRHEREGGCGDDDRGEGHAGQPRAQAQVAVGCRGPGAHLGHNGGTRR